MRRTSEGDEARHGGNSWDGALHETHGTRRSPRYSVLVPRSVPPSGSAIIHSIDAPELPRAFPAMKIVKYPHPPLRQAAQPVTAIDGEIQAAAARMLDLMYTSEGLGLAAPQIALPVRLLVMNFEGIPRRRRANSSP